MQKIKMEFNIDGIPKEIELGDVEIDKIDLDSDNPRIGYWRDSQNKENFGQDEISFALRENTDAVRRLRLSIESNEGIIEPIWVVKENGRYLVIDGNTRLEIYRDLKKKYHQKETYKKIKCRILPKETDERGRNFIRLIAHLRGVNDWEVYERARMLYILWELKGYTEEELQSTTKLSISQIKRWIEAYKEMNEQFLPNFGNEIDDPLSKFSYFVEYQNPKIQQGMKDNGLDNTDFCQWVGKKEIKKAQDVRNLKEIFSDPKATELLVNKGYKYAITQLSYSKPGFSSKLFENIEEVLSGLQNMTRMEEEEIIDGDSSQKRVLLSNLYTEIGKIVKKFR